MHYWCVLKWLLFDWLAFLSHIGKSCSWKCRKFYWLFGTFLLFAADAFSPSSFEPSSSNSSFLFFFDRTLAANTCLCRCTGGLSPLKPELKNGKCGWLKCLTSWQSKRVRYCLRPTELRWSREEELREGIWTQGVVYGDRFIAQLIKPEGLQCNRY